MDCEYISLTPFLSLSPSCCHFSLSITLLQYTFSCLLLCLVLGVWVVRKCGKAKGFSGFVHFFFLGLLIFSGFLGLLIFFSLFAFLENRKPKKPTETEIQPKPIDFQLLWSVSVENFTNQKFRFRLANT